MCQRLTFLAQRDSMRYVARCEHGTLHLRWRRSTLQLTADEFAATADFLGRWSPHERAAAATDSCISLFRDSSGMLQLWVVGVGLYLTQDDLLRLIDLVGEAVVQPKSVGFGVERVNQYRELHVAPDGVCFEN